MLRTSLAAAALSSCLVGCCTTETVTVTVPLPSALTAPCLHDADPQTVGDLYTAYGDARQALGECDDRMSRIRALDVQAQ